VAVVLNGELAFRFCLAGLTIYLKTMVGQFTIQGFLPRVHFQIANLLPGLTPLV
jgi:hypothetical protein